MGGWAMFIETPVRCMFGTIGSLERGKELNLLLVQEEKEE